MKTVKCVCLSVSGMLDVACPKYGIVMADGEQCDFEDSIADDLCKNPNFELVEAPQAQAAQAVSVSVTQHLASAPAAE